MNKTIETALLKVKNVDVQDMRIEGKNGVYTLMVHAIEATSLESGVITLYKGDIMNGSVKPSTINLRLAHAIPAELARQVAAHWYKLCEIDIDKQYKDLHDAEPAELPMRLDDYLHSEMCAVSARYHSALEAIAAAKAKFGEAKSVTACVLAKALYGCKIELFSDDIVKAFGNVMVVLRGLDSAPGYAKYEGLPRLAPLREKLTEMTQLLWKEEAGVCESYTLNANMELTKDIFRKAFGGYAAGVGTGNIQRTTCKKDEIFKNIILGSIRRMQLENPVNAEEVKPEAKKGAQKKASAQVKAKSEPKVKPAEEVKPEAKVKTEK